MADDDLSGGLGGDPGTSGITDAALELDRRLQSIRSTARGIGTDLVNGLQAAVVEGQRLDRVLAGVALDVSGRFLDRALAPLEQLVGSGLSGLAGVAAARSGTSVRQPVSAAAEAAATAAPAPMALTFNVTSPDAESFRRSEARLAGMLTRSVARGRRGL